MNPRLKAFPRPNFNSRGRQSNTMTRKFREVSDEEARQIQSERRERSGMTTGPPSVFASWPPIRDSLETKTSVAQVETVEECLPPLTSAPDGIVYNDHGVPHLDRRKHIRFLKNTIGDLPEAYLSADASRPWMLYWALSSISIMGEDVTSYRENMIATARTMQNVSGGFGGSFGHRSHLATTYAVVLSLAMVGGESAYDLVDRKAMWKWLCSLKCVDGGFKLTAGGEEDIRYVRVITRPAA